MNGNHELEKRLRATLRARAGEAPSGDGVAERVLAEVADSPAAGPPRRRWGAWAMPLLAAAAVVAVIASVLAISRSNNTAAPVRPGTQTTHREFTTPANGSPTSTVTPPPPPPRKVIEAPVVKWDQVGGGVPLVHFQAVDATFLGTKQAWLLGTADCFKGPVQACNAMVRTDDGGATWQSVPPPGRFAHIRFANPSTGYAFSPSGLKMMVDGKDWITQPGGAVALETLDDNVIRVAQLDPSCTGVCTDVVETSAVGSSSWQRSKLGAFRASAVQLQRTHGRAFLLVRNGAKTSLFSSHDRGGSWQPQADGCTTLSGGFAPTSMAVSAEGTSLHLLCHSADGRWAIVSNRQRGTLPPGTQRYPQVELGAGDQNTLFVVADRLYRSADGGQTWHPVLRYAPKGDLGPPEFQNGAVGRWFTDGGRVVWTTTNAGRTWYGVSFSS